MTDQSKAQTRAVPPRLVAALAGRPLLAQKFQHFQNAFHEEGVLDARLLELCRARIDALHGLKPSTLLDADSRQQIAAGQFDSFTHLEQQALGAAEQLAIDAHGVTDAQVAELNAALGEAATVSLLTAASMHDASIRLQQVLEPLSETAAGPIPGSP